VGGHGGGADRAAGSRSNPNPGATDATMKRLSNPVSGIVVSS
jgi:hypothetical protein